MNKLHTPDQFNSKPTLIIMSLLGLILAYLLITRAFFTGSWWQYLGTLVLLILSVRLFKRAFAKNNE